MTSNLAGVALALTGGLLVGNCMLPLKKVRIWPWECTWLVFSLVSLLLVPGLIAALCVPEWPLLYRSLTYVEILPSLLLGFGWGIAQVLFGISVIRLGMVLAFTIIVGLGTIFGTMVPLVVLHRNELSGSSSRLLMAGCGLMIAGVVLSGYAGKQREEPERNSSHGYIAGLSIAVVSGVLSSMLNLSLAFGRSISHAAMLKGAEPSMALFAVWPVALAGGLVPNLAYTVLLLQRNRSWRMLTRSALDGLLGVLMGLLWIGAVAIYGLSTRYLGRLGDSAGWAIYQITMVLTATAAGIVMGEWKSASRRSLFALAASLITLIFATAVTAASTR
jgi:L-rhamnose-H+ transport protein